MSLLVLKLLRRCYSVYFANDVHKLVNRGYTQALWNENQFVFYIRTIFGISFLHTIVNKHARNYSLVKFCINKSFYVSLCARVKHLKWF